MAVLFTFSFSTAFATTGTNTASDVTASDINEFKAAIAQEAAALQGKLVTAGTNYMNSINFDVDGYATLTTDNVKISKKVLQEEVDKYIDQAQRDLSTLSVHLQSQVTDDNLALTAYDTIDKWKAFLYAGLNSGTLGATANMKGYTDLAKVQTEVEGSSIDLAKAQYKADLTAAKDEINGYLTNLDKYSDYTSDKEYNGADELVSKPTGSSATATYLVSAVAGAGPFSARAFVKAVAEKQLDNIKKAEVASATTYTDYTTASTTIQTAQTTAKDVIMGHKIGTGAEEYYVPAVPTIEDLQADKTLEGKKSSAIKQMKASLTAAAVKMENALNKDLAEENKKAKPDTKKVNAIQKALSALDAQVTASEEVYTALINYCTSTTEVDELMADGMGAGKIGDELDTFNRVISYNSGNTYDKFTYAAEGVLKANVTITENVDALEAEAALLALQKDVNGQPLYDAEMLKDALEDETEKLYTDPTYTLAEAKAKLGVGSEVALVNTKANHVNYINGIPVVIGEDPRGNDVFFAPEDKNGKPIAANAWNGVYDSRTATGTSITVGSSAIAITANTDDIAVYDKAQKETLKTLISETEAAIKAAKSVAEVKNIFAAAQEKYEAIPTSEDHEKDWAASTGKLTTAFDKAGYGDQLDKYATYLMSTVDSAKYYVTATDLQEIAANKMYEAYTTDELATKFTEAKAEMEAALKTKADVDAEKKNVENMINALPESAKVTLADKDAITAAADALDDYNDLPGTGKSAVNNEYKLVAAKAAYEKLAAEELDAAFKALDAKKITAADAAEVEALRDLYDAYDSFCSDYGFAAASDRSATTNDDDSTGNYANSVQKLEAELSDAKVAAAKELMIKLPANPTPAQRAEVEAARAAYEALTLDEQKQIVGTIAYDNLIDAEEALEVNDLFAVESLKITASSKATKGAMTISWRVKGDAAAADGFRIYRSTKANKGFKLYFDTKSPEKTKYKNTKNLKKGTTYYYKVRAYKVVDGKTYFSDFSNKAYRKAK